MELEETMLKWRQRQQKVELKRTVLKDWQR